MSDLTASKINLGRLISEENILIEQRNVTTAYFDTESRLLVVPKLKETLSNDLIDLFLIHECAHCIFTPSDEWLHGIKEVNKTILNVVEDARIERLIKVRYPGLRHTFSRGYKELLKRDFFGLSRLNLNTLNLVDKINLTEKVGFIQEITFNQEEEILHEKVLKTKTFADVVRVAKEIAEYIKSHPIEEECDGEDEDFQLSNFGDLLDFEIDDTVDNQYKSEKFETKGDNLGALKSGDIDDEESDEESDDSVSDDFKELTDDEPQSYTDIFSKENEKHLLSEEYKDSIYVDIPKYSTSDFVVDHSIIYGRLKSEILKDAIDNTKYNTFKQNNNSVISYLIKEFMLKKNAEGRKKEKIAKTGDINLSKVYSYKITEDIFKKATITPKHQSHGLVFFLDWSASMEEYFDDTINQLICMMIFCRKMNIPFEVYAFSTNYKSDYDGSNRSKSQVLSSSENVANINPLTLMNLFSSRMSNIEFVDSINIMLSRVYGFFKGKNDTFSAIPFWFGLGNTPLNHTLLVSRKVLSEFKIRSKVNKVNAIYLTDGDSHNVTYSFKHNKYNHFSTEYLGGYNKKVYLRDKETKTVVQMKDIHEYFGETNRCVEFLKSSCDFKIFGFRLISQSEMGKKLPKYFGYDEQNSVRKKSFAKENCLLYSESSFDEFWFVKGNVKDTNSELMDSFDENDSVTKMSTKFQKALSARTNNRVFLRKYIEFIS